MKTLLLIILLCIGFQSVHAQLFSKERIRNLENFDKQTLSWGYYVGMNSYDFKFNYKKVDDVENFKDVEIKKKIGFNVGLIGNLRINDYIDIRLEPGMVFANREILFPWVDDNETGGNTRKVNSTYVHLPLLVKFSTKRINNFKPFVEAGLSTSFNLSSNEKSSSDNENGKFRMRTNTYYWEVGFGIDLYLDFFKFTPSVRGVFAMNNELKPDNNPNSIYTGHIDRMETRGFFLNLKFQ